MFPVNSNKICKIAHLTFDSSRKLIFEKEKISFLFSKCTLFILNYLLINMVVPTYVPFTILKEIQRVLLLFSCPQ